MLIWGRVAGSAIGLLWGLPGVLVGFVLGYFFDKGLQKNLFVGEQLYRVEQAFFSSTFLVMGHVAKADGVVNQAEINEAQAIMDAMQLSADKKREAIDYFTQGKSKNFNLKSVLQALIEACNGHPAILRYFLELQTRIALADDVLQPQQHQLIKAIAIEFGLPDFNFEAFFHQEKASYHFHQSSAQQTDIARAYAVLGVSENATDKEIKTAYRRQISQHHPDKLASKGLPKEMLQMAHEKTQELTLAYEQIKKHRHSRSL